MSESSLPLVESDPRKAGRREERGPVAVAATSCWPSLKRLCQGVWAVLDGLSEGLGASKVEPSQQLLGDERQNAKNVLAVEIIGPLALLLHNRR